MIFSFYLYLYFYFSCCFSFHPLYLFICLSLLFFLPLFPEAYTMGIVFGRISVETPKYTLLRQFSDFEIRQYPPQVAASVDMDAEFGRNSAFSVLASYIGVFGSPQNKKNSEDATAQSISMTAPVTLLPNPTTTPVTSSQPESKPHSTSPQSESVAMTAPAVVSGAARKMSFLLPAKYTLKTAPVPLDDRVRLQELPQRTLAVRTFSGNAPVEEQARQAEELLQALQREGVETTGDWMFAAYNPPFTLPFLKTNEIHQPVSFVGE